MMNEYRFKTDIPKEEYEQFVQSHQLCNLLQSYDWAKVKGLTNSLVTFRL